MFVTFVPIKSGNSGDDRTQRSFLHGKLFVPVLGTVLSVAPNSSFRYLLTPIQSAQGLCLHGRAAREQLSHGIRGGAWPWHAMAMVT